MAAAPELTVSLLGRQPQPEDGTASNGCYSWRAFRTMTDGENLTTALWLAEAALNHACCDSLHCTWRALVTLLSSGDVLAADHYAELLAPRPGLPAGEQAVRQILHTRVRARIAQHCGDLGGARELLSRLIASGADPGDLALPVAGLAEVLVSLGDAQAAEALLSEQHADDTIAGSAPGTAALLSARAAVHVARGRPRAGLADYLACGCLLITKGVFNPATIPWRSRAALAAAAAGQTHLGRPLAENEWKAARCWGEPRSLGIALAAVASFEQDEPAVELLREAAELLTVARARAELSEVNCDLGRRLVRLSRPTTARIYLDQARLLAEATGRAAVGRAATRASADNGAAGRPAPAELSAHERRVVELARMGLDNNQIAGKLSLTRRTVEFHLTNAYRKLGINSRTELWSAPIDVR